ncbi:copper ion binding protein [Paenibacillus alkalitolerans]|uniref:copper ion binding protein n=1 Tax=Paenibacillus alkalitolerans TaxID=2799335 RepID=UPI0018F6879F|nr:copper ion binding protein [Paenibacillus alkalitolerans]
MAVQSLTLDVRGMSCSHCVNAIERALKEIGGVKSVDVDLKGGKVTVSYNDVELDKVKHAIEDAGYEVV